MASVISSLNAGSGLDVKSIVTDLVAAERAPRQALLDQRLEQVDARISARGHFSAAINALVSALGQRIDSGDLSGIPQVSDSSVLAMRVDPGVTVARQMLEVRALAQGQTLASAAIDDAAAPIGQGSLTFHFGAVSGTGAPEGFAPGTLDSLTVSIGPGDDSLEGLKNAINDAAAIAGAPIQAQILSDADGHRLVLRGTSGTESGFVVEAAGDPALQVFAFSENGPAGMERTQAAQDARIAIDGVELRRPSNIITDLIPGARLTLSKAAPGTIVTIAAERNAAELSGVVGDLASALNELVAIGADLSRGSAGTGSAGALAADAGTRRALMSLSQINSVALLPANGNAPQRLLDIGISRTREGQFVIDQDRLAAAVRDHPAAVEAMLGALNQEGSFTTTAGPLRAIATTFATGNGTAGQPSALQREREEIARQMDLLNQRMERLQQNYTRQFAALDRNVGQSRALQSFLTQQTEIWTRSLGR